MPQYVSAESRERKVGRSRMGKVPQRAFEYCVEDYVRYRPSYPSGLLDYLAGLSDPVGCGLAADVGAGTGIFTRLLWERGYRVVAVEPNEAMLKRVHRSASGGPVGIGLLCSSAEHTGLADDCADLVTCAQSFHWFNPPAALAEFGRILSAGGGLMLVWNNRNWHAGEFVVDFEALVKKYNPAYDAEYRLQDWPAEIDRTGLYGAVRYKRFDWIWERNAEELIGLTRSVSYIRNVVARSQMPRFEDQLRGLVERHAVGGRCPVPMRTDCWWAVRQ